jgi:hypothetical protein
MNLKNHDLLPNNDNHELLTAVRNAMVDVLRD